PNFSYPGTVAVVLIFTSFILMRPDRGLAAFMTATGPGPSLARLLVPTAMIIPATMVVADVIAEDVDAEGAALIKGADKILMLFLLLWMITYASRRIQGFYEHWKDAS